MPSSAGNHDNYVLRYRSLPLCCLIFAFSLIRFYALWPLWDATNPLFAFFPVLFSFGRSLHVNFKKLFQETRGTDSRTLLNSALTILWEWGYLQGRGVEAWSPSPISLPSVFGYLDARTSRWTTGSINMFTSIVFDENFENLLGTYSSPMGPCRSVVL